MIFVRKSGDPKFEYFPKKANTAFTGGGVVYNDPAAPGKIVPADPTAGNLVGLIQRDVVSTDDDYAETNRVAVDFASPEDVFEADVEGTLTTAMVMGQYDLNAAGTAVDVSSQAKKVVTIVQFISATKALVKFNAMITSVDVATT